MKNRLNQILTLIITIHERKSFVQKNIDHYANCGINVILTDSSEEKIDLPLPNNFKYIHCPGKIYYKKMFDALSIVNTPYVIEIPDDYYLDLSNIHEFVRFLYFNDDYCLIDGRYSHKYREETNNLLTVNFKSSDPFERVMFHTSPDFWKAPNHALNKTKVAREVYSFILSDKNLYPIRLVDKIWSMICFFHGSYKVINKNYMHIEPDSSSPRLLLSPEKYKLPKELKCETSYEQLISDPSIIESLSKYFINKGYNKDLSIDFVKRIFIGNILNKK